MRLLKGQIDADFSLHYRYATILGWFRFVSASRDSSLLAEWILLQDLPIDIIVSGFSLPHGFSPPHDFLNGR
jgi:hypothetical protein